MSEIICKFCGRDTDVCIANPCAESGRPKPPAIPTATPPKCPHCDTLLPALGLYAYAVGGYRILNLWCVHCGKALHFQIFQALPEEISPRMHLPS